MLSSEQQKLFDFIIAYKTKYNGNSPSYRQMLDHMALPPNAIGQLQTMLKRLVRANKITILPGAARCISIPGTEWGYVQQEPANETAVPV